MKYRENFHTHTTYCDGKNTPEELADAAIEKGFTALGYSGHSYLDFGCGWCMTKENTREYISNINSLKDKYSGRLNIYCGTEYDILSKYVNASDYDFTIGSVHYIPVEGEYLPVDESAKSQIDAAEKYFGGSVIDYACKYYEEAGKILEITDADIIGHFDLVSKFNEAFDVFDPEDKKYKNAWMEAAEKLLPYGKPFEINTGAIARGKRITPYPAIDIADFIHSKGGFFVLTSDCHSADMLDCKFDEALERFKKYNIVSFEEIIKNQTQ